MGVLSNLTKPSLRRAIGILLGIAAQVLFLVTIWFLFWFLQGSTPRPRHGRLWVDALLAMQFAVPHSLLLWPPVRQFLGKWIAREFYALFYCTVTCAGLLITIAFWQSSDVVIWQLQGVPKVLVQIGFLASWIALTYSLNLTGFGTQTGLPQWWNWVRRRPLPYPQFKPHGAYALLRHPVYLSFAGLIWFTPRMTLDHAILTGLWTAYLLLGSFIKDRRMEFYLGTVYRDYQRRVPGFPLMPFGPLARHRSDPPLAPTATTPTNERTNERTNVATQRDAV